MLAYSRVYEPNDGFWIVVDDLTDSSRKLMRARDEYARPSWSRDGRWIAAAVQGGISIANVETSEVAAVTQTDQYTTDIHPTWSPAEDIILFGRVTGRLNQKRSHIISIRPDGSDVRILTDDRHGAIGKYSADGQLIIFAADRTSTEYFSRVRTEVWVMNSDGSEQRQLTNDAMDPVVAGLRWIGRSRQVCFMRYRDTYALDVATGERRLLPSQLSHCDWSPDGIAAYALEGALYTARPPGFEPVRLHADDEVDWGPGNMAWSSRSEHLAAWGRKGADGGVYVINVGDATCESVGQATGEPVFSPDFP